jgi:uncharacterized protein (DUF1697 family)
MVYVALLRGINVGGNNKVEMKRLKVVFEQTGMTDVVTYINSGNVIFQSDQTDEKKLTDILEKAIEAEFGFYVKVLIRSKATMEAIVNTLPDTWVNDTVMKTDVLFLWEGYDTPDTIKLLSVKPDIDRILYVPGAILWSVDRVNVTKSGMVKVIGTDLYRHITVRNCNTFRKLISLMNAVV